MDYDGVLLDSYEGFIISSGMVEVLGSTIGLDEGTYLVSSDGSFYGYNDVTLDGSWLEDSIESYDEHALGSFDEAEDGIF